MYGLWCAFQIIFCGLMFSGGQEPDYFKWFVVINPSGYFVKVRAFSVTGACILCVMTFAQSKKHTDVCPGVLSVFFTDTFVLSLTLAFTLALALTPGFGLGLTLIIDHALVGVWCRHPR
jgi:hypothetical protein